MNDLMRVIPEGSLWDGTQVMMLDYGAETRCLYEWIEDDKLLALNFFDWCEDCGDEHVVDQELHMFPHNPIPELWATSEHSTTTPWVPDEDYWHTFGDFDYSDQSFG